MSRTSEQEFFGDAIAEDGLVDPYRIRLPYAQGGCRFYVLGFDGPNVATLPDARLIQIGEAVCTIACTTSDIEVQASGGAIVTTLVSGDIATFYLTDNSTQGGSWAVVAGTYESGSPITEGRVFYDLTIDRDTLNVIVLHRLEAMGYDGVTPVVARVTIAANVTVGSWTTDTAWGFATGGLPAGSTVFLTIEPGAVVTGKGGAGGYGGDVLPGLLAGAGQTGGHAMLIQDDTVLVNYGTIQGGGGGGGGGGALSTGSVQAGGGGGGGAGWQNTGATGGTAGNGGGATPGYSGSRDQGGTPGTGYVNGGSGGWPGTAGTASTAAGGAAGDAIQRLSSKTLTKVRAGTITGAETTY